MKMHSFFLGLLILVLFSMNLIGCDNSSVPPTSTLSPTQTSSFTATSTKTETPAPTATLSPDQLSQMTVDQKLGLAPEIDGFTKSNISENKNNLIIYRNADGIAQIAYDILTAKESALIDAGIIEIDLTDGTKWEMPAFMPEGNDEAAQIATLEEMANFMVEDGVAWGYKPKPINNSDQQELDFLQRIKKLPSFKAIGGFAIPYNGDIADENKFTIVRWIFQYQGMDGSLLLYHSDEGDIKMVFVNIPEDKIGDLLENGKVRIPTNPQQ